jgi:catechol 2,3-dioxygenase-like lactoylglutathione lyase family enzyme
MQRLAHIGIRVTDLEKSERFYKDVLNCRKSGKIETDSVRISFVDFTNGTIELVQMLGQAERAAHAESPHLAFEVQDIEAEFERVRSLGVELVDPRPRQFHGGSLFFFKGPDGESIEFCSKIRIDSV